MKILCKSYEDYISIHIGYVKAIDMYRFFHPMVLDAISKTLKEECMKLNKYGLERRKGIFLYQWLDSVDKLPRTQLPPK